MKNSVDISHSQLPQPCLKGDFVSIKIYEEEYMKGVDGCKNDPHGRLILKTGEKSPIARAL